MIGHGFREHDRKVKYRKEVYGMPGFDRTGPMGEGPRTGRALGKCGRSRPLRRPGSAQATDSQPRTDRPLGRGAGLGGGRGRGRGRGRM
jgi:hypothetical protein